MNVLQNFMRQASAKAIEETSGLRFDPRELRRMILRQSRRANVGHIGSCLCIVEILSAVYSLLRADGPDDRDRDRFILSKGHAALALYAVLHAKGWISEADLDTFCADGSYLSVHPNHRVPGVDFETGSLGQGITMAAGAALAARLHSSSRRVYCVISDAECNEGSTWEAAMFSAHQKLANLSVILDANGQQALGLTRDVIDMPNLAARWAAFGWAVSEVDGHSVAELKATLAAPHPGKPQMIIARTIFGRGVSFMEAGITPGRPNFPIQPINWHYLPLTAEEFDIAMRETEATAG